MSKQLLWKRFYDYIVNVYSKDPERWVTRKTLFALALSKSYTNQDCWDAIEMLEKQVQIAVISGEEGRQYRYLNMTYKEQKKLEADIRWFDKLPG